MIIRICCVEPGQIAIPYMKTKLWKRSAENEICSNWVQEKDGGLRIGSSILTRRGGSEYDVPEAQNTWKTLKTHIFMFSDLIFDHGFPPEAAHPVAQGLKG